MMNEKVFKIIERYELDKPIMMQDKLDMIWDKPAGKITQSLIPDLKKKQIESFSKTVSNKQNPYKKLEESFKGTSQSSDESDSSIKTERKPDNVDQQIVRKKLKKRKIERSILNGAQIKVYKKLIDYLTQLRTKSISQTGKSEPNYAIHDESVREFLDAFRMILQSGYFIQQEDFLDLIQIIRATHQARTQQ